MKEYLREKFEENNARIRFEAFLIEEKFRKEGCPTCGQAVPGNGKWVLHGGAVLTCPHMERHISARLKKRLSEQQLLLEFMRSGCPTEMLLYSKTESRKLLMR